jgi:hypothetical protein
VIRNNAKAELERTRAEKDRRVIEFREAKKSERDAQTTLSQSKVDVTAAETKETQAKTEEAARRVSHGQAEAKVAVSKTEFETATANNIAYKAAAKDRDDAKLELDDLTTEIRAASAVRTAAEGNLTKVKTDSSAAVTKSIDNIASKASEWVRDLAKDDFKKIPLNSIMVGFDRDKSPMDTKEAHEALQRSLVEETLKKAGAGQKGGGLSNLLNVKSSNFDPASKILVERAEKIIYTNPLSRSDMKNLASKGRGKNSDPKYSGLTQLEKNAVDSIININQQRLNRGLPDLLV